MPMRPRAACLVVGCPQRAVEQGRCRVHATVYDRQRGTASQRGYTSAAWTRRRQRILRRDGYLCRHCGGLGNEVDHIVSKRRGGTDDDDNLQTLCKPCHARKTQGEGGSHL